MRTIRLVHLTTFLASFIFFSLALADSTSIDPDFPEANPELAAYNQVGKPIQESATSLTLNNHNFGEGGPLTVSGTYSSAFGYQLDASYTQLLNRMNAISILGSYAEKENRLDITWAHAWDAKQRTKVSVERLSERLDFNYDAGSESSWVPQYAIGAGYQYSFQEGWVSNIEFSGYYARSESKDLDTVSFTGSDGFLYNNYRHIAGATTEGVAATANLLPWKTGIVGAGLNYDAVTYHNKYDDVDASNSQGLGFTLTLQQILSKHVKLDLSGSKREIYDNYQAKVSMLTPNDMELGFSAAQTIGRDSSPTDNQFSFDVAYYIDDHSRYATGYRIHSDADLSDLAAWASKSLAYMNMVLAAADQQTERVVTSLPAPNHLLQSNGAPTIYLVAGEINKVDIASYVADITSAQGVPTVSGGPEGVTFQYDAENALLITNESVPEEDAGQVSDPIVLAFSNESNASNDRPLQNNTEKNQLVFDVTVTNPNQAYPNQYFQKDRTVVIGDPLDLSLKLENVANPAKPPENDPDILYVNPSSTMSKIYVNRYTGGVKIADEHNCYSYVENEEAQTLTFSSKVSAVCPDSATFTIVACNQQVCADSVEVDLTASAQSQPYVKGGMIDNAAAGSEYHFEFPETEVSPGDGSTYKTDSASTYMKVMDDTSGACHDITSTSNLQLNAESTKLTLASVANKPVSLDYAGHTLKVYLHVTNKDNISADNGTGSACGGSPFRLYVESGPTINSNIAMGTATVDVAYQYDFVATGVVTQGSSAFDTSAGKSSAIMKLVNNNGSETEVTESELGLGVEITGDDVVMQGMLNPAYAGKTLHVYLDLFNTDGLEANNASAPATLILSSNPNQHPVVAGGSALTATDTGVTYPGNTFTKSQVTAGSSRSYVGLNGSDSEKSTYVKIADTSGENVTADVHVLLAENVSGVLELETDLANVSPSLPTGTYNVYVHVYNDANDAATNCVDKACSKLTGGTPFTMLITNTKPSVTGGSAVTTDANAASHYAGYSFTPSQVSIGDGATGFSGLNSSGANATFVRFTNSAGQNVTSDMHVQLAASGSTLSLVSDGTVTSPNLPGGDYNVYLYITNNKGVSASNCADGTCASLSGTPFTLHVNPVSPTVTGGSAITTDANVNSQYAGYAFTAAQVNSGASSVGFSDVNGSGLASTFVRFTNSAGRDVTSDMHIRLTASGSNLSLVTDSEVVSSLPSGSYNVYLYVTNDKGESASNCDDGTCQSEILSGTPYILAVHNSAEGPTVGGGKTITGTDTSVSYPGYTFTDITSGAFHSFQGINSESNTGTYVKVVDANGVNKTSLVHVQLADNGSDQLVLGTDGSVVSSHLIDGDYYVYVHVYNGSEEASNCGSGNIECANSGLGMGKGNPYVLHVTNTQPVVVGGATINSASTNVAYQTYTFDTANEINSGAGNPGYKGLNQEGDSDGTYVKVTDSAGNLVTSAMNVELAINGNALQLVSKAGGVVSTNLATGPYKVFVYVTNNSGEHSSNCSDGTCNTLSGTPFIINLENTVPIVDGGSTDLVAVTGSAYPRYDFTNISPGSSQTYASLNASPAATATYVKIADGNGRDVTNDFNVELAASGDQLSLVAQPSETVAVSLNPGTYYAYVHVYNSAGEERSNCRSNSCSELTGGNPYEITVTSGGMVLTCPSASSAEIDSRSGTPSSSIVTSSGNFVENQLFSNTQSGLPSMGKNIHLYSAVLSADGRTLTCNYNPVGSFSTPFYYIVKNTSDPLPGAASPLGADWSGNTCFYGSGGNSGDDSCKVTFTYS